MSVSVETELFIDAQLARSATSSTEKCIVFIRGSFPDGLAESLDLLGQPVDAYKHLLLVGLEVDVLPAQLDVLLEDLLVLSREQVDRTLQFLEEIVVLFAAREDPGEYAAEESPGKCEGEQLHPDAVHGSIGV
jgi:hypothetical protein